MRDFIDSLVELDHTELFERARTVRGQNALSEWQLAAMLMAIERQRAYLECDCSSITVYAEKKLGLHPKKTRAMLRLARLADRFELASKAFKDGSLCWTKLREIGRVLDEQNEAKWVRYAVTHTVRQVEKAVAKPPASLRKPTSRLEYPTLFDVAACPTTAQCGPPERVLLMPGPDKPAEESYTEDGLTEEEYDLRQAEEYLAQQRALKAPKREPRPLPDWISSAPTDDGEQPEEQPPPTQLIRMTFVFKAEEYAAVEAALRKAQGQVRKRQPQSALVAHVMQQFLASGSECTKARYPVVIQIEGHDAVYVTDRGDLPVEAERLQGLLAQARPARKSPARRSNSGIAEAVCAEQPTGREAQADQAQLPSGPMSQAGEALSADGPMSHVGQAVSAAGPMSHVGQALSAAGRIAHVGQALSSAVPMSHVGQTLSAAGPMYQAGEALSAAGPMSHVGQALSAAGPMSHVGQAPGSEPAVVPAAYAMSSSTMAKPKSKRRTASRPNAIREVMARSGWACVDCGSRDRLQLHHETPICRGGSDDTQAQVTICDDCHAARHHDDFTYDPLFEAGRRKAQERRAQQSQRA
jgi:hypothetical protein